MKTQKKRSIGVVIGCCLIYAAVTGIGSNCRGIFYAPVAAGLQVSLPEVTTFSTYYGITAAIFMPLCCKFFHKVPAKVSLTLLGLIFGLAEFCLGSVESVSSLYILGSIQGLAGGFLTYYPIQNIIGNWFPERKGTVLGFVLMSSGILGIVLNPLATSWITAYGWRIAYRILALMILLFSVPASLFLMYREPDTPRRGLTGGTPTQAVQSAASQQKVTGPVLAGLFTFLLIICLSTSLTQHLPNCAISQGKTAAFGAILVSVSMAGNLLGKIVLGPLNDRLGGRITTVIAIIPVIIGCLLLAFCHSDVAMLMGAFPSGLTLSIISLQSPLLFRSCLPSALYDRIYSVVCSINILVGSFSQTVLSLGYAFTGNYELVMMLLSAGLAVCALIVVLLEIQHRRNSPTSET